jgi:hypothetical protein
MPLSFSNLIVAIVAAALIACSSASNPFDNHFKDLLDHNMVSHAQKGTRVVQTALLLP